MNPKVKEKWVKALRSGEYAQIRSELRNTSGYCCLGVLCQLKMNEDDMDQWEQSGSFFYKFQDHSCHLPPVVSDWSDLLFKEERELTRLNDREKWNFNQIADWIEENL